MTPQRKTTSRENDLGIDADDLNVNTCMFPCLRRERANEGLPWHGFNHRRECAYQHTPPHLSKEIEPHLANNKLQQWL
jgi:hypothetical protein